MPKLEGCLFSVAEAAKTDIKWPLHNTNAEGNGKVNICSIILVTQAFVKIKTAK